MKNPFLNSLSVRLISSAFVFFAPCLYSADFPQASAAAQISLKQGFTKTALPVLIRSGSVSAEAAHSALVKQACAQPCQSAVSKDSSGIIRDVGPNWLVEISKDGSAGRFEDRAVLGRSHLQTKAIEQRMSQDALQRAGLAIIQSRLGSIIQLGSNEQLVPITATYRMEGGQNVSTGEKSEGVAANRVVFGRVIDGVPVVGGGSRISITFANDGSLESFRYDWPSYKATVSQNVVDKSEIFNRLEAVLGARTDASTAKPLISMPSPTASYPLALTSDMKLQKLECGYYDSGLQARDSAASVQTGCAYHVVLQGPNGMRRGFAGAIPTGLALQSDAKWPELQIIQGARQSSAAPVPGKAKQP